MLVPWKESYDQPRQYIKEQRHCFADKGPFSQSYGFSSSHVWMWEVNHKEGLKLKLQYFGHLMKEPTHWKRPWCWERLKAKGEGDDRGWDGWMASLTQWTWVWVNSGRGDGQAGLACCDSWGHRVRHDWGTELNWWDWMPWSSFFECWVLSQLFHSPLSLPLRGSIVPLCFLS